MQNIIFEHGKEQDISKAVLILNEAKKYLKSLNIDQWQDSDDYPNEANIRQDMQNNAFFVARVNGEIAATFMTGVIIDETYIKKPIKGDWLTKGTLYGVLHRIAVGTKFKGHNLGASIAKFACEYCKKNGAISMRSDTHKQNIGMQKTLLKSGFEQCGEIILPNGANRIIFEKKL